MWLFEIYHKELGITLESIQLFFSNKLDYKVLLVIISEMACIVANIVVTRNMSIKAFEKWLYSGLISLSSGLKGSKLASFLSST